MAEKKTVLITGGSGGIGTALTHQMAADGWRVLATARDPKAIKRPGDVAGEVIPLALELTDDDSITAAAAELREQLGPDGLDGLVNNAGVIVQGPLELVPASELRRQFDINVLGQMAVTQAVLPLLRQAGGRIVNLGAPSGRVAIPMLGPIGASKAALHFLNDSLRMELRHQGISVSLVIPGQLETEIFDKAAAAAQEAGPSSAEVERVYAKAVEASAEKMAELKGKPVDATVKAIRSALTERRPKARYIAGSDARQLEFLRRLPTGLQDRILMSTVGLSEEEFAESVGAQVDWSRTAPEAARR
jgi:NAD(P)-dependent dehydrogenase (short-subunit alcohol dehydrogenase family)